MYFSFFKRYSSVSFVHGFVRGAFTPCALSDGLEIHAVHRPLEHIAHPPGFRFHDVPAVLVLPVAVRRPRPVRPVFHAALDAPLDVLRHRARFVFGQPAEEREQKFVFHPPRVEVFFLEVDWDAELQEMAHHLQAVRRVAGEAAQRLRDDAVDEPVLAVLQKPLERRPRLLLRAADALVAVDARENPVAALGDDLLEVFALRLQAFLLLRHRRRNAAIGRDALLLAHRLLRRLDFRDRLHILTPVSVIRSMSHAA